MAVLGWFDPLLVADSWFDPQLAIGGFFDPSFAANNTLLFSTALFEPLEPVVGVAASTVTASTSLTEVEVSHSVVGSVIATAGILTEAEALTVVAGPAIVTVSSLAEGVEPILLGASPIIQPSVTATEVVETSTATGTSTISGSVEVSEGVESMVVSMTPLIQLLTSWLETGEVTVVAGSPVVALLASLTEAETILVNGASAISASTSLMESDLPTSAAGPVIGLSGALAEGFDSLAASVGTLVGFASDLQELGEMATSTLTFVVSLSVSVTMTETGEPVTGSLGTVIGLSGSVAEQDQSSAIATPVISGQISVAEAAELVQAFLVVTWAALQMVWDVREGGDKATVAIASLITVSGSPSEGLDVVVGAGTSSIQFQVAGLEAERLDARVSPILNLTALATETLEPVQFRVDPLTGLSADLREQFETWVTTAALPIDGSVVVVEDVDKTTATLFFWWIYFRPRSSPKFQTQGMVRTWTTTSLISSWPTR